jgi:hemolysin III
VTVTYAESTKRRQDAPALPKPRLRGWLHAGWAPLLQVLGLILLVATPTLIGRIGVAIYLVSATILFGMSAVYHRGNWSDRVAAWLRRLDHSNIFLLIAGTYTPLSLVLLQGADRIVILSVIWGIAALGITFKMFWMSAPRWLYTGLYLAMGWVALWWLVPLARAGGPVILTLIIVGGVVYTLGAVVYALKMPNPSPTWFGFHEIFHACTIIAAGSHFAAIAIAMLR